MHRKREQKGMYFVDRAVQSLSPVTLPDEVGLRSPRALQDQPNHGLPLRGHL